MTREERDNAITILENEKKCVNRANKNDYCNRDCYNCELVKTDTEILTALDMAIKALQEQADTIPVMYYPQVDGITPTVVAQADGEKTCGTCRNEDTYHCAECENKSDYEQSQADGDLISRQAVKEAVHTLYQGLKLTRTEDDVQRCINELPSVAIPSAEPKTEWIPVSERLPEKNVWVLVTVVQGSGWYVEIMRIDKYKGMFTDNIDYYDSIIAWMPLPKPYKAESEDK